MKQHPYFSVGGFVYKAGAEVGESKHVNAGDAAKLLNEYERLLREIGETCERVKLSTKGDGEAMLEAIHSDILKTLT